MFAVGMFAQEKWMKESLPPGQAGRTGAPGERRGSLSSDPLVPSLSSPFLSFPRFPASSRFFLLPLLSRISSRTEDEERTHKHSLAIMTLIVA